jgi:hypothetical protein
MGYNSKRLLGKPDNPSPSSRRMPLPRGASQAAVEAGCAGDWQKRQAKRGGTHAACAPVEGACERRSRVRCGADRSLGEWQRLWIGSNVGWGVVSCRRRFAKWNPKRADPSARALFYLKSFSPPYTDCRTRLHEKRRLMTPSCRFPLPAGGTERVRHARFPAQSRGEPNPCTVPLAKRLTARQFLGELEVRQILPPSYRFPPRAGGTKQRFPLRSRGNLTEGVFKKCRAMSAKRGEPHGGGNRSTLLAQLV